MMNDFSSWGSIEPDIELPKVVKKTIQKNVMAQLTMTRFIGSIVDLYLGKVGETIVGLVENFDDDGDSSYTQYEE
jgi:hypothetical protein